MRALRKGQAAAFNLTRDIRGEARIVERAFGNGVQQAGRGFARLFGRARGLGLNYEVHEAWDGRERPVAMPTGGAPRLSGA